MDSDRIVILADESANWRVAGLPQLQRLALALNKFAETLPSEQKSDIFVIWAPSTPAEQQWLPKDQRLVRCRLHSATEAAPLTGARVLSTHLLLDWRALDDVISIAPSIRDQSSSWDELAGAVDRAFRNIDATSRCIHDTTEIPQAEHWLLRHSGKSQDGVVAKFLNRPISRALSRSLLKTSLTPDAWTLSILVLPLTAFLFLCRGDYLGFVAGSLLFQLFSILDGCDGEIARAKYLESEHGRWLDNLCDVVGNVLFAVGLGLGLQRLHGGWYATEGTLCAAAVALNEWLLARGRGDARLDSQVLDETFYPRHRAMLQRAGLLVIPEEFWTLLFQLTKRDVAIFFFLLLAIANCAQWILHLWTAVAVVSLLFALIARARSR
jgi:phosphatidylglycerophosphate synthase